MVTMMTLGTDTTVLYTRTPEDRRMDAWEEAVARVLDTVDMGEWDNVPTHEPINISTGVLHEWGYYGWGDDTRHRTTPRARKNRATK